MHKNIINWTTMCRFQMVAYLRIIKCLEFESPLHNFNQFLTSNSKSQFLSTKLFLIELSQNLQLYQFYWIGPTREGDHSPSPHWTFHRKRKDVIKFFKKISCWILRHSRKQFDCQLWCPSWYTLSATQLEENTGNFCFWFFG